MEHLVSELVYLGCPASLQPQDSSDLIATGLRSSLLAWLYAVDNGNSERFTDDENWQDEGRSTSQLETWLLVMGLEDGPGLLCDNVDPMRVLGALLVVTETVHGRMLIEEQGGEEASLLDTTRLMDDLATHHESVFDDRCEIFPLSIQMLVMHRAGSTNQDLLTTTLIDDEVAALEQQKSALVAKIATAKQRIQELGGPEATSGIQANLSADPTTLSRELGCRLAEALILIERVTAMLNADTSTLNRQPQPKSTPMQLGQATATVSQRINRTLQFLEDIESVLQLSKDHSSLENLDDVISHCQQVAESVSLALRGQTDATELAATSTSPAEDVEQCQTELQ